MRPLADYVRSHGYALAPAFSSPIFRRLEQPSAGTPTSLLLRHDQSIDFRAQRHFQQRRDADVQPSDHLARWIFSNKDGVTGGPRPTKPLLHLSCRRGIAQFTGKLRQPRCIIDPSTANPDRQPHVRAFVHEAFFRRRVCTASLFNSRRASAAIQRAVREFIFCIFSAS